MGVYARPDSVFWWALLEGTDDGKGNPIRFSTKIRTKGATSAQTTDNRKLADAAYHAKMADHARDRFELPTTKRGRTFDQHAAWYLTHHTARHRGALQETRKIARLRRFFGRYTLKEITPNRWQEYTTERTTVDGVGVSTVGRELAIMKAILNTAIGEHLEYSPLFTVKRRAPRLKAKRTITAREEPAFVKALRGIDRELHDLYLVGVGTLLRRENLLSLTRGSHRRDRLVVDTKTGPHQVPLNGPTRLQRRAAAVLRRRMPKAGAEYFFPKWHAFFARYDDPGHPSVLFLKKVRRAAKAAGIPWGLKADGIVWHTATRATGATRMLREHGVDVRTVQLIGGWSSLDQMADYLGMDVEMFGTKASA